MANPDDSTNASISKQKSDSPPQDNDYLKLRKLLLGADYDSALQSYVSKKDDAERVASVLAQAIRQSTRNDPAISKALAPLINKAIHESTNTDPSQFTNVIYPILGPAIRKSVAATLREMVQNLNKVLEQSLSPKGIIWRYRAWRAGVSYGRYVISQTLKYCVEQVLLVHRETGILLHAVANDAIDAKDPELMSSMLTAIQDFVCDSFETESESSLERIEMGDFTLHIVAGPFAIVAVAVRGTFGEAELAKVSEAIELIHQDYHQALEQFDGNRDPFDATDDILRECLISEELQATSGPKRPPWLALIVILAIAAVLSFFGVREQQRQTEFNRILEAVEQQEGYILLNSSRNADTLTLSLLKDINAIDKNTLIEKLDARKVHINMSMQELTFGAIDTAKLDALALPLPPIKIDDRRQYRQQLNNINSHSFYFELNATELNEKELARIPLLVNAIKRIISLSNTLGLDEPQIMLLGFADANGSSGANFEVSRERAELVKALLINNGIQEKYIQAWGMGHKDGPLISANNQRRVSIHLLDQLSNAVPEGL